MSRKLLPAALVLFAAAICAIAVPNSARAWSYQVLYNFCSQTNCADGTAAQTTLAIDSDGNLYGMADSSSYCNCYGEVFKLGSGGGLTVLHYFTRPDEGDALSSGPLLLGSAGTLYGLSTYGGTNGYGSLFKILPDGSEVVLYSFCSDSAPAQPCTDGAFPHGGLVRAPLGGLYGTTYDGGANGQGTVFKFTHGGRVIYSLGSNGANPNGGLVLGKNGRLYGTTNLGVGTVFEVTPKGIVNTLYSFCAKVNCNDGWGPQFGLDTEQSTARSPVLFGTTPNGGAHGAGTIFELFLRNSGFLHVLHAFCSKANCADGQAPSGSLVNNGNGELYGVTYAGGANGMGTVYSVNSYGGFRVLHSFCSQANCADGWGPTAGLTIDAAGNLYGVTPAGGANGQGVIFELSP